MLAIRLQRTGRKGHAQYRVVVQDSHRSPTSGKIVAQVGHYNPHSKAVVLDKEKVSFYLEHGAQPSDRIVKMLTAEGVTLPKWVKSATTKERAIRNPEKLRRNRPAEEIVEETPAETPADEAATETEAPAADETVAEESASQEAEAPEVSVEEPIEAPAETEDKAE
jgi:small subunit ribosomal protein S16